MNSRSGNPSKSVSPILMGKGSGGECVVSYINKEDVCASGEMEEYPRSVVIGIVVSVYGIKESVKMKDKLEGLTLLPSLRSN